MQGIMDLTFWQMVSCYLFLFIVLGLFRRRNISGSQELLISCLRMTVQLMLAGYLLTWILKTAALWLTGLVFVVMIIFAILNSIARMKRKVPSGLKKAVAMALAVGTTSCLLYFLLVVLRPDPWFDPQYVIPLGGMIIGNAMTGVTLAMERLLNTVAHQSDYIEGALMLGAKPAQAMHDQLNTIIHAALLPTINSMMGMGIVLLPGMMTGQILSGASPLIAIKYQIAIMLAILGSVALTVVIFVQLGYRTFFNAEAQLLKLPPTKEN